MDEKAISSSELESISIGGQFLSQNSHECFSPSVTVLMKLGEPLKYIM